MWKVQKYSEDGQLLQQYLLPSNSGFMFTQADHCTLICTPYLLDTTESVSDTLERRIGS